LNQEIFSQRGAYLVPQNAPQVVGFNARQDPDSWEGRTGPLDTDGGTQAVVFSCKDHGADAGEIAPTMRSMGHHGSHANGGGQLAVAVTGDVFHTLRAEGFDASEDGTGRGCGAVAVALRGREGGAAIEVGDDVGFTLRASTGGGDKPHVWQAAQVRRLTPTECERLQGFADGYTMIPWRGKPTEFCPDGPRYKALGNSMAVPVMHWIGRRIDTFLRVTP